MIISASRRTDIPAFYAEWFIRRLRAGGCIVPHPLNPRLSSPVSLKPEDVDVIVFWTRNPRPLMPHLDEMDRRGYRYYFLYTVMENPRLLDPGAPPREEALATFAELARRIGPRRVVWRYDPIILSNLTDGDLHARTFREVAQALRGCTSRCIVSFVDVYRKSAPRLKRLSGSGLELRQPDASEREELLSALGRSAAENGMEIATCAEDADYRRQGFPPGKCVDDELIRQVFGCRVDSKKDPSQRRACGCVVSRDIGVYDTCPCGCVYCYATTHIERARANCARHDPDAPSLISSREGAGPHAPVQRTRRLTRDSSASTRPDGDSDTQRTRPRCP